MVRDKERLQSFKDYEFHQDLDYEIIEGSDGARLGGFYIDPIGPRQLRGSSGRMYRGEAGCKISHLVAWAKLLSTTHEYGLILEDDSRLKCADGIKDLAALEGLLPQDCFITVDRNCALKNQIDNSLPFSPQPYNNCVTAAYIVSRSCASILLEMTIRNYSFTDKPVDTIIGEVLRASRIDQLCLDKALFDGNLLKTSSIAVIPPNC